MISQKLAIIPPYIWGKKQITGDTWEQETLNSSLPRFTERMTFTGKSSAIVNMEMKH